MIVSLGQVWMGKPILTKLYKFKDQFNVKTNFKLGRNINIINNEYDTIEQIRLSLIKKFGVSVSDKEGLKIEIPPERIQEFKNEFADILKQEIEINLLFLEISVLKDVKELMLTPMEAFNFRFLLSDYDLIKKTPIQTTYKQLVDSQPVIDKIIDIETDIETSAKISKIFLILNIIFNSISEYRSQLVQEYNIDNWQQEKSSEKIINFNKDLNKYMIEQRTIDISIIDIEKLAPANLDPMELNLLSYMFDISGI